MEYLGFFLIVLLLVTVHEFGHFVAAKLFELPVELFSLGFGKPIYRTHVWGCEFRLSQIPLGGYVKLQLDRDEDFYQIAATKRIGYFLGAQSRICCWLGCWLPLQIFFQARLSTFRLSSPQLSKPCI